MANRWVYIAVVSGMLSMLVACAGGISRQARSQVTCTGSFSDVLENPTDFRGQTVAWGGRVIEIQNQDGFSEIVALQLALDSRHRPTGSDSSQGRFLIRSARFIDPAVYAPGTLVTVIGRLQGAENRPIGEMSYRYPVLDMVEIQRYDPRQDSSPRFHIGIGIGGRF